MEIGEHLLVMGGSGEKPEVHVKISETKGDEGCIHIHIYIYTYVYTYHVSIEYIYIFGTPQTYVLSLFIGIYSVLRLFSDVISKA